MRTTIKEVEQWARDKDLLHIENSYPQFCKVVEEVSEVGAALNSGKVHELIDAIGDSVVTLIILAAQNGLELEECLDAAYNEIKGRTGKTVNGTFIKD